MEEVNVTMFFNHWPSPSPEYECSIRILRIHLKDVSYKQKRNFKRKKNLPGTNKSYWLQIICTCWPLSVTNATRLYSITQCITWPWPRHVTDHEWYPRPFWPVRLTRSHPSLFDHMERCNVIMWSKINVLRINVLWSCNQNGSEIAFLLWQQILSSELSVGTHMEKS